MDKKIILRNIFSLSFAGEVVAVELDGKEGVLLKPSDRSEMKIWCPKEEIKLILMPDGRETTVEVMKNEFGIE